MLKTSSLRGALIGALLAMLCLSCFPLDAAATVTTAYSPPTYACSGSTTGPFLVTFPYLASADLVVTKSNNSFATSATLTLTTDYTVSPSSSTSTGAVTLTLSSKCASGYTLKIARNTPKTQPTSFRAQTAFKAQTVETALDRGALIAQEVAYAGNITATTPITGTGSSIDPLVLPAASGSVNGYLSSTTYTRIPFKDTANTFTEGQTITAGTSNDNGLAVTGHGAGNGAVITGGSSGGTGAVIAGGGAGAVDAAGATVTGYGASTGLTVNTNYVGSPSNASGAGVVINGNTTRAPLRLAPLASDPVSPSDGGIWATTSALKAKINGSVYTLAPTASGALTTQEAHATTVVNCAAPLNSMTLTVGATGTYLVTFSGTAILLDGGSADLFSLSIQKGGADLVGGVLVDPADGAAPYSAGTDTVLPVNRTLLVSLTVGDVVTAACSISSGAVQFHDRTLVLVKVG